MANLDHLGRVLHGHDWKSVIQWAIAVDELADLSDEEIDALVAPRRRRDKKPVKRKTVGVG